MRASYKSQCVGCESVCKSIFREEDIGFHRVTQHYKKGETLFHEGMPCTGVYCLSSGKIKLFKTEPSGSEMIMKFMGPGEFIGHGALAKDKVNICSAVALEDSECCFFVAAEFMTLLRANPALMFGIFEKVESELAEAFSMNVQLARKNVRERAADFFVRMAQEFGTQSEEVIRIDLKLTREEIASYLGTAHETAIRIISEFKAERLIREEGRCFYVLNLPGLKLTSVMSEHQGRA